MTSPFGSLLHWPTQPVSNIGDVFTPGQKVTSKALTSPNSGGSLEAAIRKAQGGKGGKGGGTLADAIAKAQGGK